MTDPWLPPDLTGYDTCLALAHVLRAALHQCRYPQAQRRTTCQDLARRTGVHNGLKTPLLRQERITDAASDRWSVILAKRA